MIILYSDHIELWSYGVIRSFLIVIISWHNVIIFTIGKAAWSTCVSGKNEEGGREGHFKKPVSPNSPRLFKFTNNHLKPLLPVAL